MSRRERNQYGSLVDVTERSEQAELVRVTRRNGAWMLSAALTEATESCTPEEAFDCASSLTVAKREARAMAAGFGYRGPFRWIEEADGHWVLHGVIVDEVEEFVDGD